MNQISLNPHSITRWLVAAVIILVFASIGGQLSLYFSEYAESYRFVKFFNVDAEGNIPTYFSVLLTLVAALLLVIITIVETQQESNSVRYWAILALGFFTMAADEAWIFHERLGAPVRKLLGDDTLSVFYFAWVVPAIVLVTFLGLFFSRFLLRLPLKTRVAFLIAASVYLSGVIGVETIGGRVSELHGKRNLMYILASSIEESLEMLGIILFIRALLLYIAENYKELRFQFEVRNE